MCCCLIFKIHPRFLMLKFLLLFMILQRNACNCKKKRKSNKQKIKKKNTPLLILQVREDLFTFFIPFIFSLHSHTHDLEWDGVHYCSFNGFSLSNVYIFCFAVQSFFLGFPGDSVVKNLLASAGDVGSTPLSGRSPGEGNGNPLENSCFGNSVNREAW